MVLKYVCDRCGAEVETQNALYHVSILNGFNTAKVGNIAICEKCADEIAAYTMATPVAETPEV